MKIRVSGSTVLIFLSLVLYSCQPPKVSELVFENASDMVQVVQESIQHVTADQLKQFMESGDMFLLLDVRTKEEHDLGYIPGSVLVQRGLIEFRMSNEEFWEEEGLYAPMKDDLIILYCRSGSRSSLAVESLQKLGYTNIFSLDEGFLNWKELYPDLVEINLPPIDPTLLGPSAEEEGGGSC